MAALWRQKAEVKDSIVEQLQTCFAEMNREQLLTFARQAAAHMRSGMTLEELKLWDEKLKKEKET